MNKDLITAVGTAIVGAVAAFFICNMFLGPIEEVSFKTVKTSVASEIESPSPEVFNYHSLNPTVEVYVGECQEISENGECLDDVTDVSNDNNPESPQENL